MQLPPDGPIVAQCGPPKAILELELTTGEVGSKVDREAMLGNGDCSFFFSVSLSLSPNLAFLDLLFSDQSKLINTCLVDRLLEVGIFR